ARCLDRVDHGLTALVESTAQTRTAAVGHVVSPVGRIDDTTPGECQAALSLFTKNVVDRTDVTRMLARRARLDCGDNGGRLVDGNRAKAHTPAALFDLDQGLKPVHAARAGAHDGSIGRRM